MYRVRGIAGRFEFRMARVWVVRKVWSGEFAGEGEQVEDATEITEGGGHPPGVKQIDDRRLALLNLPAGSLEVGPITPKFETETESGGTDISLLIPKDGISSEMHFARIETPTGSADYQIVDVRMLRPLAYSMTVRPLSNSTET